MKNNLSSLHCQIEGTGKPLLLLHAFPLSGEMWEAQIKSLSARYQVLVPDLPGFGKSPLQSGVTIASMAQEIILLLDQLKITEPVFVAGLSMGGYVGFELLRQFPKRLCGLGLFATRASADTPEAKENRFKSIQAMEQWGLEPFARKAVKSQLGSTTEEKKPALMEKVFMIMKKNKAESAIAAQRAMAERRDSSDLLPGISFPVLVVAGDEDKICPAQEMREMHEKIPGSEFHEVPGSGHLINLEQPEAFQKIFEAFLKTSLK